MLVSKACFTCIFLIFVLLAGCASAETGRKIIDVPGPKYSGQWSLRPMKEILEMTFLLGYRRFADKYGKKAGCTIFKAHPGVATVMVTCHASVDAVFAMGPDIMNRDGFRGFGPYTCPFKELVSGKPPILATSEPEHSVYRGFADEIMEIPEVYDRFTVACNDYLKNSWPCFNNKDRPNKWNYVEAANEATHNLMYQWLFGIEALGYGKAFRQWNLDIASFRSDSRLSRWILNFLKPLPKKSTERYNQEMLDKIESSYMFQKYYLDIGKRHGFSAREACSQIHFSCQFNSGGPMSTLPHTMIAIIEQYWDIGAKIMKETEGVDDIWELDALPYLDSFYTECMRLFGPPKHFYRKNTKEVYLPTTAGELVRIPINTEIGLLVESARCDPSVFRFPLVFDPERYLRDPSLTEKVWRTGPNRGGGEAFGCAGTKFSSAIMKTMLISYLRNKCNARLDPQPRVDFDTFDGIRPASSRLTLKFD